MQVNRFSHHMASLRLESSTSSIAPAEQPPFEVPIIDDNEPLVDVVRKLYKYSWPKNTHLNDSLS